MTVTKPATATSPTDAPKKTDKPSPTKGTDVNQAEIVPTAVQPTGLKGTLVATGSNLPLMLLLSLMVAGLASYLILRHPLGSNPHTRLHD